jgi:subtilisin family serine protease/fibronectin type 3 domain-containing protein
MKVVEGNKLKKQFRIIAVILVALLIMPLNANAATQQSKNKATASTTDTSVDRVSVLTKNGEKNITYYSADGAKKFTQTVSENQVTEEVNQTVNNIMDESGSTKAEDASEPEEIKEVASTSQKVEVTNRINVKKGQLKEQSEALGDQKLQASNTGKEKIKKENEKKQTLTNYAQNEVIIKFTNTIKKADKEKVLKDNKLKHKKSLGIINADVYIVDSAVNVENTMKKLKAYSSIEYVEPNYVYYPDSMIADPYYGELWGLENNGQEIKGSQGVEDMDIDMESAWTITTGSEDIVVGIIDSGIYYNHPDLQGIIWTNEGEIPDNGIDDDMNGYIDDIHGWDFYNNDSTVFDPYDGDQHATHVAGTIAARWNNIGVTGIAPKVKIMSLKFLGPEGGYTSDAILALEYARNMGVKITNNSWGGGDYSQALEEAIAQSGMLFVAAAGNEYENSDITPHYPASYECDNILSVASINNQGYLSDFSNYGLSVDVAAPGETILSTVPNFDLPSAVISDTGTYKTMFQGFGYEIIQTPEQRAGLMSKALEYFGITYSDSILLVQDDESGSDSTNLDVSSYYANALIDLGYGFTNQKVVLNGDIPLTSEELDGYDLIIWYTGEAMDSSYDTNITTSDQEKLIHYMDNGGNLYLAGRDAGWAIEGTSFYQNYLHTLYITEDNYLTRVIGSQDTIFVGEQYDLYSSIWMDYLKPSDEYGKVALFYNIESLYSYYNGTSMATPHVTGIGALLMSLGDANPLSIKTRIMNTTQPLASLQGLVSTGGLVNAPAAILKGEVSLDDDIPGVALQGLNIGTLDATTDMDDVYSIYLIKGENVKFALSGDAGTDFDLYLYSPGSTTVHTTEGLIQWSEGESSDESIEYLVEESGVYYVDAYAYSGSGQYSLSYEYVEDVVIDDQSSLLNYVGEWGDVTSTNHVNGSAKQLNSTGSVSLSFIGSKVVWTGFKNPSQGIARVYIDNVLVGNVNLYSTTSQYKQILFEQGVEYGTHNFRIEWAGIWDKKAKKTSSAINIDTIVVTGQGQILNPEPPAHVEAHPLLESVILYYELSASDFVDSYNIYRSTNGMDFEFIGSNPYNEMYYFDDNLQSNVYYYKVTAVGNGVESAYSDVVSVTPLLSNSSYIIEDTNDHLEYTGTWTMEQGSNYSNETRHVTLEQGATIKIPYTGYESHLYFFSGPDMGMARLYSPFGDVSELDLYSPSENIWGWSTTSGSRNENLYWLIECLDGKINFDYSEVKDIDYEYPSIPSGLTANMVDNNAVLTWDLNLEVDVRGYLVFRTNTPGANYVQLNTEPVNGLSFVDATVDTNLNNFYCITAVDYAGNESSMSNEVELTGSGSNQIIIEENDSAVQYSGTWYDLTDIKFSGGTAKYSKVKGAYAELVFEGTDIELLAYTTYGRGKADVYIDGEYDATIDMYTQDKQYQYSVYKKSGLTKGTHTIRIENMGEKNPSATSTIITIDAFVVSTNDSGDTKAPVVLSMNPEDGATVGAQLDVYGQVSDNMDIKEVSLNIYYNNVSNPSEILHQTMKVIPSELSANEITVDYAFPIDLTGAAEGPIDISVYAVDTAGNTSETLTHTYQYTSVQSTVTVIEESDSLVQYSGTWYDLTDSKFSGGTAKYSKNQGNYAELNFFGNEIELLSYTTYGRGKADIYIDGVYDSTIDMYTPDRQYQYSVYKKAGLPGGAHTIRIENIGEKNPSSTSTVITIDAFVVTSIDSGDDVPPVILSMYPEDGVTVGSQFDIYGQATDDVELYDVYAILNYNNATGNNNMVKLTKDILIERKDLDTEHDLRDYRFVIDLLSLGAAYGPINVEVYAVDMAGNTSAVISCNYNYMESQDTTVIIEDIDPVIFYNGVWSDISDSRLSGSTAKYTDEAGAYAELTFMGTEIQLLAYTTYGRGKADIYIDGVFDATIDMYTPDRQYQSSVYKKVGLSNGTHTIRVEYTGEKNPAATSTIITLDAFVVTASQNTDTELPSQLITE